MELIVFDLDGTLLNRESTISDYTSETLKLLSKREIAYTVATGRTLHGARALLEGHRFDLPQAYKNGVMIWHPEQRRFSNSTTLTAFELENVVRACLQQGVTPFVFTLDDTMEKTRSLWPDGIKGLPMNEDHKIKIMAHWSKLQADFKIG